MGEDAKTTPVLADPAAAGKVSEGVRKRVSESIDTTGKALTAIAGLGVFFFATGYFIEWQRLKRGHLPPEEIMPLISKDQIAAAGVRELVISFVFGAVTLLILGIGFVFVARATQGRTGLLGFVNAVCSRELAFPTIVVGVLAVLFVPFSFAGLLVAATLTGLLYCGLRWIHRYLDDGDHAKFPFWQLCLAIAIAAVVLSGVRQHEFPQSRPWATLKFDDGRRTLRGSYIASDADKVLIRVRREIGEPRLIVLDPDELRPVRFQRGRQVLPGTSSLFDEVVGFLGVDIQVACIPPECSIDHQTEVGPSMLF